jgi:uncharacterized protein YjbJ (UPF0337 family)
MEGKGMNWNDVGPRWKQAKGKIQIKWGRLTDDDLDLIDGRRDRLECIIQRRYGFASDHIRKEVDDWVRWQTPPSPSRRSLKARSKLALVPKLRRSLAQDLTKDFALQLEA